mgnify:CR=1 FL=1
MSKFKIHKDRIEKTTVGETADESTSLYTIFGKHDWIDEDGNLLNLVDGTYIIEPNSISKEDDMENLLILWVSILKEQSTNKSVMLENLSGSLR